jgi:hypothetical protein
LLIEILVGTTSHLMSAFRRDIDQTTELGHFSAFVKANDSPMALVPSRGLV